MRAWTILLVPSVACLAAFAPHDEDSLIQKDSRLRVSDAEAQADADDHNEALHVPSALSQIPAMDGLMGNMSMPEMMAMATEMLGTLRDKNFVKVLNDTLRDVLTATTRMTEEAGVRTSELKVAGESLMTEDEAYHLLKEHFKKEKEAVVKLTGVIEKKLEELMKAMPNVSLKLPAAMSDSMEPQKIKDLVQEQLSGFFGEVISCTNATLCAAIQTTVENMTIADNALSQQALPMITQAESMIPSIGPMIGMIAPDVVDTVVSLVNSTIKLVGPAMTLFRDNLHGEVHEVTKIAKVHTHCTFGSGSGRSGPGLFLLAAALSVWMSLQA